MSVNLSRLKQVELREAWQHEAYDFTKWLAEDENIELLSDEIGVEIVIIEKEASVGRFNVDILAEESNTGNNIIIENQLEKTDHDHLGKLITYAAGIDAGIVIWVVKETQEEHQQAVEWLNEKTNNELSFFLVQIELWQIDDSNYAPKINVIEKPNYWSKDVKSSVEKTKLTDTKKMQLEFWTKLKDYAQEQGYNINFRKPRAQHWYDISFGTSEAHISLSVNTQKGNISTDVYIPDSPEAFDNFYDNKEEIEAEVGSSLDWQELPEKKASRVRLTNSYSISNNDDWSEAFDWMIKKVLLFKKVFSKYI
jgi:PIN domain nuclease of toxin-antitoxin system